MLVVESQIASCPKEPLEKDYCEIINGGRSSWRRMYMRQEPQHGLDIFYKIVYH